MRCTLNLSIGCCIIVHVEKTTIFQSQTSKHLFLFFYSCVFCGHANNISVGRVECYPPTIPLVMDFQKRQTKLMRIRKKKERNVVRKIARVKKQRSVFLAATIPDEPACWANLFSTTHNILPPSTRFECERSLYLPNANIHCDKWLEEYDIMDYTVVLEDEYEIVHAPYSLFGQGRPSVNG